MVRRSLNIVSFLVLLLAPGLASGGDKPPYRIDLEVVPGKTDWRSAPVIFTMDEGEISGKVGIRGDFSIDLSSIRVFEGGLEVPCRARRVSIGSDSIAVSWVKSGRGRKSYSLYFDILRAGEKRPYGRPSGRIVPNIGDGGPLSYGRDDVLDIAAGGLTGHVDVDDWDGDGSLEVFVALGSGGSFGTNSGIYLYERLEDGYLGHGVKVIGGRTSGLLKLFDMDGDGLKEILTSGGVYRFERFGPEGPIFRRAGELGWPVKGKWEITDWDGDGLFDLLVSVSDGAESYWPPGSIWSPLLPPYSREGVWRGGWPRASIEFFKNVSSASDSVFRPMGKLRADGEEIRVVGDEVVPVVADFDGDGDMDLVCGGKTEIFYFENIGTHNAPLLDRGVPWPTETGGLTLGLFMRPDACDWDGDGDIDLIVAQESGRLSFIENLGPGEDGKLRTKAEVYLKGRRKFICAGCLGIPDICDWDGDGDVDIIVGNSYGFIEFFEGLPGENGRMFAPMRLMEAGGKPIRHLAGPSGSVQGPFEAKFGYTGALATDWDGDGDLDLLVSDITGLHFFYENVGSRSSPVLAEGRKLGVDWGDRTPDLPPWNWRYPEGGELVTQQRMKPEVMDWDGDGITDYVSMDSEGFLALYRGRLKGGGKVLLPPERAFLREDGSPIRLNEGVGRHSGRIKFDLVDWDGDGDLDILVGCSEPSRPPEGIPRFGNAYWYENVGGKFRYRGELISRDLISLAGHSSTPVAYDWDGDGVLDLLIGAEDGFIYYFHRALIENDLPSIHF